MQWVTLSFFWSILWEAQELRLLPQTEDFSWAKASTEKIGQLKPHWPLQGYVHPIFCHLVPWSGHREQLCVIHPALVCPVFIMLNACAWNPSPCLHVCLVFIAASLLDFPQEFLISGLSMHLHSTVSFCTLQGLYSKLSFFSVSVAFTLLRLHGSHPFKSMVHSFVIFDWDFLHWESVEVHFQTKFALKSVEKTKAGF